MVGPEAKEKAQGAKENFKKGFEDAGQTVKLATGYEGSKLQEAKENFAQGWESTKKKKKSAYDDASKKLSEVGSNVQKKVG